MPLHPGAGAMYPPGYQTFVEVESLSQGLCGASRPGHFRGVATVVLKLLNQVSPHVAVFGEKDYQQLMVVKRMVADLEVPTEIVGRPIVREPDGLAMSSRNTYLNPAGRAAALCLYRALLAARELVPQGPRAGRISWPRCARLSRRPPAPASITPPWWTLQPSRKWRPSRARPGYCWRYGSTRPALLIILCYRSPVFMLRVMMKSKIHRATITQADLHYEGSLTISAELMRAANILPYEMVHVYNVSNGNRFETYAIEGEENSGVICLNGAASAPGRGGRFDHHHHLRHLRRRRNWRGTNPW